MKTIRKILVPIDFAENPLNVLQQAINFTNFLHAQIILLHVYNRPIFRNSDNKLLKNNIIHRVDKTLLKWRENRIDARFDALLKDISNVYDTHITIIKSRGLLINQIRETIKTYQIDMVIGGINYSMSKNQQWRSKVARLTNKIDIPLLLLPYDTEINKSSRIALAYDLKEIKDLEELNILKLISSYYGADIHIFTVRRDNYLSKEETRRMEMIKEFFAGYSPEIHVVRHPDVGEGIQQYLKRNKISLLTVVHRSRNKIKGMFHTSISRQMAIKSEIPLLTIEDHS